MNVCHTCDNPSCVNPKHLFLGTQKDNVKDMQKKGRAVYNKGENFHASKLSNNHAIAIKWMKQQGYRFEIVWKTVGANRSTTNNIFYDKAWKHVQVPEDSKEIDLAFKQIGINNFETDLARVIAAL